jgi:hypothetical protein
VPEVRPQLEIPVALVRAGLHWAFQSTEALHTVDGPLVLRIDTTTGVVHGPRQPTEPVLNLGKPESYP